MLITATSDILSLQAFNIPVRKVRDMSVRKTALLSLTRIVICFWLEPRNFTGSAGRDVVFSSFYKQTSGAVYRLAIRFAGNFTFLRLIQNL
jgi:hypothetical protein